MSPAELCRLAYAAGLELGVQGDLLMVGPRELIEPEMRALLKAHKPDLMQYLAEAEQTAEELATAALAVCTHWNDTEAARRQMLADCAAVPPHQRRELLDHLRGAYGGAREIDGGGGSVSPRAASP